VYPSVPDTYKVLRSDFRDMDGIIARSRTIRKANPGRVHLTVIITSMGAKI
jgi:hypothetical protein